MGGINLATVGKLGTATLSLLNTTQKNNQKINYLSKEQEANAAKRKNLLEQQLASRRAGLGAMGITSSRSAVAAQERLAKDAYDSIANDDLKYQQQYENLQAENDRKMQQTLLSSVLSASGKIIK